MVGSEEKYTSLEERKAKIRERYKGIDPNELDVIPAILTANIALGASAYLMIRNRFYFSK